MSNVERDRVSTSRSGRALSILIVDDSAVMRTVMTELLRGCPDFGSVRVACDPLVAMERMKVEWPDVIVLDLEMPRMDGLTFLRKLMQERPTPVVICSTLTQANAAVTLEALGSGAIAVVPKPTLGLKQFLKETAAELISTIRAAGSAKVAFVPTALIAPGPSGSVLGSAFRPSRLDPDASDGGSQTSHGGVRSRFARTLAPLKAPLRTLKYTADVVLKPLEGRALTRTTDQIVAIGTSTGGTQALERILTRLPRTCPGLVVVQHMPEHFTAAFAARLETLCDIAVLEAKGGERVLSGRALIAPGGKHMLLRRSGAQYYVDVVDGPPVNRHKPSVDVLFRSVAKCAGNNALGIILTGMGDDGAAGLLEMRLAGASTLAQDEGSCVVYGMPKEAVKRGAVVRSVPLDAVAQEILGTNTRIR